MESGKYLPSQTGNSANLFVIKRKPVARKAFETMHHGFTGGRDSLIEQLIRLDERFFSSDKLEVPSLFHQDPLRKRILIALSVDSIVQHVIERVHQENAERLEPVFDP